MPLLRWNEIDFLDYLEVEPNVLDEVVSHRYSVERMGLKLLLTLWQLESMVQVTLFRDNSPENRILSFAAGVRGSAKCIDDQRGRYLEFSDCIIVPSRSWYRHADNLFDRQRISASVTIEIAVNPDIRIDFAPVFPV